MIRTVFATNKVGAFGNIDGSLPWPRNVEDMRFFSRVTRDAGTVIMGRATYESIIKGADLNLLCNPPLKGRNIVVLTSQNLRSGEIREEALGNSIYGGWSGERVFFINAEVTTAVEWTTRIFGDVAIIGGAGVITQSIQFSDEVYMTLLDNDCEADIGLNLEIPSEFNCHTVQTLADGSGEIHHFFKTNLEC